MYLYIQVTLFLLGGGAGRACKTTDPAVITNEWASAEPSGCNLLVESGPAPEAGDTGCAASHGEGAVAWSVKRYCQDKDDWLLYCVGDTWTASSGNTMSQFAADGQPWALVSMGNSNFEEPDDPAAWLRGEHTGNVELNSRCDNRELSGWRNGGTVAICVADLENGIFTAAICTRGRTGDSFQSIGTVGSSACPMASDPPLEQIYAEQENGGN